MNVLMKIYVPIDREGITNFLDYRFVDLTRHNYKRAWRIMMGKANAIIHADDTFIPGFLKSLSIMRSIDESFEARDSIALYQAIQIKFC